MSRVEFLKKYFDDRSIFMSDVELTDLDNAIREYDTKPQAWADYRSLGGMIFR